MIPEKSKQKLVSVPIERVRPNPAQPRRRFGAEELNALAASISENGLIQPIVVRKQGNDYILIAGERRLRAAKIAGLREIRAVITECGGRESAAMALIENLQRRDLSVFEEAAAIRALMKEWGLTQEETARRLGISQPALANKLRLLRLLPEEQKIIEENRLTERHARAVLRLDDPEERIKILETVVKNGLNVKKTEDLVARLMMPIKRQTSKGVVPRDIRLFINTIDRAVTAMRTAGIQAKTERRETDDYIECVVRIPKNLPHT